LDTNIRTLLRAHAREGGIKTLAIGHQYQDAFTRARARGSELEFCKKLIDFFDVEPREDHFIKHYHTNGKLHWIDIKRLPRRMPTLRAFAKKIGVNIQMIYNWLNEKHGSFQQEFLDAFTCARDPQGFAHRPGSERIDAAGKLQICRD